MKQWKLKKNSGNFKVTKLALQRDTIAVLSDAQLRQVAGGVSTDEPRTTDVACPETR
jgi:hypothetical protein